MDIKTLFSTRIIRLFCYGFLSVVLALYLIETGLTEGQIGFIFTLTLAGDAGISLWLTTSADRFGRKRTLVIGALLMLMAGAVFILTDNVVILMDVPTRQSYTAAVAAPDERSAASGVTAIARSVGASISPALTGIFLANPALFSLPFFLSGGLKIIYDLLLYRSFVAMKPPEEK